MQLVVLLRPNVNALEVVVSLFFQDHRYVEVPRQLVHPDGGAAPSMAVQDPVGSRGRGGDAQAAGVRFEDHVDGADILRRDFKLLFVPLKAVELQRQCVLLVRRQAPNGVRRVLVERLAVERARRPWRIRRVRTV